MLPPDVLIFDDKMPGDGVECGVAMRPLVNGAALHNFIGRPVTLVGNVISVNPKGISFDLKTSDMQIVIVSMRKPLTEPISGLIEVQGIVQGRNSMVCDYYMAYPDTISESYDQELTNKIFTLIHSLPNSWVDE
ncbi:replication protein A 14 kDa subunit [Halyomorpha halys]|uniref:replication protein A 14 kDa subunit n=1 Tax=Halyomorpha halys TaxID=286706 RepID=UPI0006D4F2A9|nr:uncharacterized protein LOC106686391 [Halyomorpha halys]